MKRLISIALIFCGITSFTNAQQDIILLKYGPLEKKLQKSDVQIKDSKKQIQAKTWFDRGLIMQDIANLDLENTYDGIAPDMVKLYYKNPVSSETKDGVQVDTYERMKYFYENGQMVSYQRLKSVTDDPLNKALEAYQKALQYDEKGKFKSKVKDQLVLLKYQYQREGINKYYLDNKKEALVDIVKIQEINDMDMFKGTIDTIMIQYTGIIAREIGDYPTSIKAYKQLAEIDFGGPSTYIVIKNDYTEMGDSAQAINIMKEAFKKYPDTLNVVANLVDLYIRTNSIEEGLETIDQAIKTNPNKGEFYYWKGRLLLNRSEDGGVNKALEVYKIAIEKNPDLYYVYYDMGFIYFLQGQDLYSQGGLERDDDLRKQYNDLAAQKYKEAIPALEKSISLNVDSPEIKRESLDVLKRIYYKLQMEDKYKDVTNQLENMAK